MGGLSSPIRTLVFTVWLLMVGLWAAEALVAPRQESLVEPATNELQEQTQVRRPNDRRLRERIIADAVANAVADVIRTKAEAKATSAVQQTQVTPSSPTNTKEFAYTNIRFKSFVNEDTSRQDDSFLQSLQESAMHDAHEQEQKEATKADTPEDTADADLESQLNLKLAQVQKEMNELEELKKELAARKAKEASSTNQRRLLSSNLKWQDRFQDTGIRGWDPMKLVNKKSDMLQDDISLLQKRFGDKAASVNDRLIDLLNFGTETLADVVASQGDRQIVRSDAMRTFLDAARDVHLGNLGKFQNMLESVMDNRENKYEKILDRIF
ncbi:hypothetical protein PSENEW3n2_00000739 [Picochlorum sp. SENEW3]|nr:hypothetical protein PSENEW3n2_00000739 [Picochlorum sp. SENEW3]WPT15660.1 hypothetical protein PSENEW3_00000739 [Picochlorum sp. SENEW3]